MSTRSGFSELSGIELIPDSPQQSLQHVLSVVPATAPGLLPSEVLQTKALVPVPTPDTPGTLSPLGPPETLTAAALLGVGLMKWSGSFIGGMSSVVGTIATLAAFARWYRSRASALRDATTLAEDCVTVERDPHAATFCTGDRATDERILQLTEQAARDAQNRDRLPRPVLVSGGDVDKGLVGAKIAQHLGVATVTVDCAVLAASEKVTGVFMKILERQISGIVKDLSREGSRPLTGCVLVLADLDHLMVRDSKIAHVLLAACNRPESSLKQSTLLVITSHKDRSATMRDQLIDPLEVTVQEPKRVEEVACLLHYDLKSAGLDEDTSELLAEVFGDDLRSHSVRRDVVAAIAKPAASRSLEKERVLGAILDVCYGQKLEGIPSPKTFEFDGIVAAHEALAASAMELPVVGVGIQSRSSGATVYRQRALESSLEGAMMGSVMKELVLGWVRYLAAVQHYEGRRHLMPLTSLDFIQDLQPHLRKWVLNNTAHGTHQENESRDRIEMVVAKAEEAAREMVSCFTKGGSVSSFLRSATPPSSGPKPIELVGLDFNQTCDMFRTEIAAAAESFGRFVSECS